MALSIIEISKFAKDFKRKHNEFEIFILSDPGRRSEIANLSASLPKDSNFIIRHFGNLSLIPDKHKTNCRLIYSFDTQLFKKMPRSWYHVPSNMLGAFFNARRKGRIFSASAHNQSEIRKAHILGAKFILVSCIFESKSPSAKKPIGRNRLAALIRFSRKYRIIALGGINQRNFKSILNTGIKGIAGVSFE